MSLGKPHQTSIKPKQGVCVFDILPDAFFEGEAADLADNAVNPPVDIDTKSGQKEHGDDYSADDEVGASRCRNGQHWSPSAGRCVFKNFAYMSNAF